VTALSQRGMIGFGWSIWDLVDWGGLRIGILVYEGADGEPGNGMNRDASHQV